MSQNCDPITPKIPTNPLPIGPTVFFIGQVCYKRIDLTLTNCRNQLLKVSHYQHLIHNDSLPTIIYLHGNSSSRLEVMDCIDHLLPKMFSVVAFDFSGSGHSEGQFISLGHYEKFDLQKVVEYVRNYSKNNQIGLWGRSMGAVTALMYAKLDPQISVMVLDSPFSSLRLLSQELGDKYTKMPGFLINMFLKFLRDTVMEKNNFDIDDLDP